jgi:hypothetical protein
MIKSYQAAYKRSTDQLDSNQVLGGKERYRETHHYTGIPSDPNDSMRS